MSTKTDRQKRKERAQRLREKYERERAGRRQFDIDELERIVAQLKELRSNPPARAALLQNVQRNYRAILRKRVYLQEWDSSWPLAKAVDDGLKLGLCKWLTDLWHRQMKVKRPNSGRSNPATFLKRRDAR